MIIMKITIVLIIIINKKHNYKNINSNINSYNNIGRGSYGQSSADLAHCVAIWMTISKLAGNNL